MCGRYASAKHDIDLVGDLDVEEVHGDPLPLNWNVAPTQDARIVVRRPQRADPHVATTQLRTLRWGLVPSWADNPKVGASMINARVETLLDKPAFTAAARRRRCLVPADGYYEWLRRGDGSKQPYYLSSDRPIAFAGLYEFWRDPRRTGDDDARWLATFTILTSAAPPDIARLHDRAPVVVPEHLQGDWLDPRLTDAGDVASLLDAIPSPRLIAVEVSAAVNDHRNNGPHLVEPAAAVPT